MAIFWASNCFRHRYFEIATTPMGVRNDKDGSAGFVRTVFDYVILNEVKNLVGT